MSASGSKARAFPPKKRGRCAFWFCTDRTSTCLAIANPKSTERKRLPSSTTRSPPAARELGIGGRCEQHNAEGAIVDALHAARKSYCRHRYQSRRVRALLVRDSRRYRGDRDSGRGSASFEHRGARSVSPHQRHGGRLPRRRERSRRCRAICSRSARYGGNRSR